jgi:hypothetical protein
LGFIAYNARLGRIFGFGTRLVKKIAAGGVEIEINSETVELAYPLAKPRQYFAGAWWNPILQLCSPPSSRQSPDH